jgi:hypothetical protein
VPHGARGHLAGLSPAASLQTVNDHDRRCQGRPSGCDDGAAMTAQWPLIVSTCADCGVGTIRLGEWYMVNDDVWEQAWAGRRKSWQGRVPGTEILCIACLEQRLGRTLMACDFIDVEVNSPSKHNISERMRDRLSAVDAAPLRRKRGRPKGSKNKPKRKRGRPPGSKNKPKAGQLPANSPPSGGQ